ncbi:BQ5605_C016g08182 [Microbotryum silenes-dioicae]|uniref:BQ5605_C016g08182 protein n=1 Tax=Microbotryum silenes-dioicae TaxID=796604 RepID=A0A2X0M058_9BASI|nr:BQ5605_C016g08182 [Microbotryum silenes-dioicae]
MDSFQKYFDENTLQVLALAPSVLVALVYAIPFLTVHASLAKYPGPVLAKFSRLWLAIKSRFGVRSLSVHELHMKHGKFVRIGPNEVSIADPAALPIVYGHGTGSLKADFYSTKGVRRPDGMPCVRTSTDLTDRDYSIRLVVSRVWSSSAFVAVRTGLFNTRDRQEHTRKRKIVAHTFSQKSVQEFEPYIAETVRLLLKKWDELCDRAKNGASGGALKGYAVIETLDWYNALAFDTIGDLAFGSPFGMLERDAADIVAITREDGSVFHAPAVKILNERGEFSATQGALPPFIRPYTKYFDPWFARGLASVNNLSGIARHRVGKRLEEGSGDRKDILAHLLAARDGEGKKMPRDELTAEALTQLIAGSDTTSNSSCAIMYYIVKNPRVHKKLQAELDEAFGAGGMDGVLDYADVKALPYLQACINEALRRHSTSGMGLPRLMTQETEVCGEVFKAGTILSVPSYTIHHLNEVWGDPWEYRPERWLEQGGKDLETKCLNIFSFGPRSCVGRNVAMMELLIFVATFVYRYDFKLAEGENQQLEVAEGFLRKPLGCKMGIKRRTVEEI